MDQSNALSLRGGGLVGKVTWPKASDWLIRDEFTDSLAAGSVNGTAATPGPGTRVVADAASVVPVASGYIANTEYATWNVRWMRYGAQTRAAGLAVLSEQNSPGQADPYIFGWSTSTTPATTNLTGIYQFNSTGLAIWNAEAVVIAAALAVDTWHSMAVILRGTGMFFLLNVSGNWKLLWVISTGNTATMYPAVMWNRLAKTDDFRVIQLPAPFDTDDGLATDTKSGSVAAGTTFTHEADFVLEFTVDTLPSANSIWVRIRRQDNNNFWLIVVNSVGLYLFEVVAGTYVQRALAGGAVASGNRVVVIAEGSTIKGYSNNTLRWTYSSATNFATATAGEVNALGTGGAVSNLKTWPRTLSGTAASILNKVSA